MLTVIGHPFANIGMGEQLRSSLRALRSVYVPFEVVDVYRYSAREDDEHFELLERCENDKSTMPIRLFHINGDEIDECIRVLEAKGTHLNEGYNIIMPAWELPNYPEVWGNKLAQFSEVWAISDFVRQSLRRSGIDSIHIGQACEFDRLPLLPRRHFGIREGSFAILNFLDFSSYRARKNPEAIITTFSEIIRQRPFADIQLVLKVKGTVEEGNQIGPLVEAFKTKVVVIDSLLSTFETLSLINACDCFVSLHRAEGFGRGAAEAMLLGKLALATNWSGNLDYMNADGSMLVDYELVPVQPGQYPYSDGQHWAEPSVDHATSLLTQAIDDAEFASNTARAGRNHCRLVCSNRSVGIRMLDRLDAIMKRA
jgi:Glycosyl transferases group 1